MNGWHVLGRLSCFEQIGRTVNELMHVAVRENLQLVFPQRNVRDAAPPVSIFRILRREMEVTTELSQVARPGIIGSV